MKLYLNNIELSTEWIVKNAKMIHYFGLGFIQVKLNEFERLHFYTDKLPTTVGMEEIHNHRYNFVSTILKGQLYQEIYDTNIAGNTHIMTKESCTVKKAPKCETICTIIPFYNNTYYKDQEYYIDHNTFHTVHSTNAITHIVRSEYKKLYADVIRPIGIELTCPFSANVEQDKLIEIIDTMLK